MIVFAGIASSIFHMSSTSLKRNIFSDSYICRNQLGIAGLLAVRKFFGVILLAIAMKVFAINAPVLIK
jgi:hypothetical protein